MAPTDFLYYLLILLILLAVFAVFWVVCGYLLFRLVDRKLRSCPNCKRGATGIIMETETEPLGTHIDRTGRQAVRIKAEKVIDHFQCNRCGHSWIRSFERKQRYPLDGQTQQ